MAAYYRNSDGAYGDRRYDAAVDAQVALCGPCYAAGRPVVATMMVAPGGYAETEYYCGPCAPAAAVPLCMCGEPAAAATGFCAVCATTADPSDGRPLTPGQARLARIARTVVARAEVTNG